MKHIVGKLAVVCIFLAALNCCSAMDAARTDIEYRDLRINVIHPSPIFLLAQPGDKVAVQIRDHSRFEVGDEVWNHVKEDLEAKGYKLVKPREARFIAQVVITSNFSELTAREIMGSPDTGAVVGGVAGGVIGAQKGTGAAVAGAAIGAAAGALADLSSSLVKVGRLDMEGVLRILEKRDQPVTTETRTEIKEGRASSVSQSIIDEENYKKLETGFTVTAEKKGLKWEECQGEVKKLIAKQISDTFGK
jgi:hypothetical protein